MSFDDLLRIYGPAIGAIIAGVVSIWGTVKLAMPRLIDAWIADREKRTEVQTDLALGARQDDIALLSQVVNLTNQVVAQNKELIAFITDKLAGDLQQLGNEIKADLRDIDGRWLAASRELSDSKAKAHILSMEVARLADSYRQMEERIASLVAFGLEKEEIGKRKKIAAGDERGE